jgi:DNA-binding MarR family transcriptional regulator
MKKRRVGSGAGEQAGGSLDKEVRELTGLMFAALSRFQVIRRTFARALKLSSSEFAVVISLHDLQDGRGIRIRELAEKLHVAAANVTATVKRLEARGWVVKALDPADSRALSIKLDKNSRKRLDRFFETIHPVNEIWFAHVTQHDKSTTKKFFSFLIEQYPAALHQARLLNLR